MWTFFFFIFYFFPTAQKLESKAQSLPHVYPSTSIRLSLSLGHLGEAVSPRATSPFIRWRFSTLHAKTSERKLDGLGEELATIMGLK